MAYERVNWENSPSTATPLNATNLNKMDEGIANLDEGVTNLNAKFGGDGILDISKGGTGNNEGYIQTGYKALSVRGSKVTIEGNNNEASANYCHAEGSNNVASRNNAHVEGRYNVASGTSSHAQGESNRASGSYSHAGGEGNVAGYSAQTVVGKYNDNKSDTLFEVGNGTSDDNRKNAFEVSGDGISTDNGITKIRFGKNDANQYGYYRGDDPNLILFDSSIASCAGIGKKTGVNSSGVIDTDIILGRNPEKGDRFLVYFDSKVGNANSMKIYVTSGSFVTPSLFEGGLIPPEYYLNGLCLFEYKVDNILSSYYLDLIYRKEDKSYTAGRGININNDTIANSMPQLGDNVQCKSVDSVTQGRLGSYSGNVKYLLIHFDTDAEPYNGVYSLVLSYSGSVAITKYGALYDRVMGMEYDRKIYGGSTLLCEIMDEGTGTEADPVHVDVLGVIDGYVTAGWGRQAALGDRATAEGIGTEASGNYAHAHGYQTTASGNQSTAMGYGTTASADGATAMGNGTTASGANSLAQGYNTTASGAVSTAIGTNTQATQQAQFAMGKYNKTNNDALLMVGNGTAANARKNALEVLLNGDVVAGNELIDGQGNTLSVLAEALTKTASGNPVLITDCAGGKARSLKTTIEAIQDLHGYDHPWAGGAGKNKIYANANDTYATNKNPSDAITGIKGGMVLIGCSSNTYIRNENITSYTIHENDIVATGADNEGAASYGLGLIMPVEEGQSYTIQCAKTGGEVRLGWLDSTGANISYTGAQTLPVTVSPATGASYLCLVLIPGQNKTVTFSNIMVEKGSTATSFAPWENKCPISGRTEARVDDNNKNLIENVLASTTGAGVTFTVNADKTVSLSGTSSSAIAKDINSYTGAQLKAMGNGQNLVLNGGNAKAYIAIRTSAWAFPARSYGEDVTLDVSQLDDSTTYYVTIGVQNAVNVDGVIVKPMLRHIGASADYVPYTHSSATIQLGQTVYGADINWDTGVMTVKTALVTLNGTEDWNVETTTQSGVYRYSLADGIDNIKLPINNNTPLECNSNMYVGITANESYVASKYGISNLSLNSDKLVVIDETYHTNDATAWKAYLANNPLQIEYVLATPTTIQLTPTQLQMLKGYNRVTIDNGSIELGYIAKVA